MSSAGGGGSLALQRDGGGGTHSGYLKIYGKALNEPKLFFSKH
jgi:hypothetical protein